MELLYGGDMFSLIDSTVLKDLITAYRGELGYRLDRGGVVRRHLGGLTKWGRRDAVGASLKDSTRL